MIIPSAVDVLYSIEKSLETMVRPGLSETPELSCLATVSHMLRHVAQRIELEGQNCLDDIAGMRRVLHEVVSFLDGVDTDGARSCSAATQEALEGAERPLDVYPSLQLLSGEVSVLREALQSALKYLVSIRSDRVECAQYGALREAIRQYLADEIRRESRLIHPAFENRGPRR